MYTACPHCQTVFTLQAHQLSVAHGHVRCGRCGEVYFAVDHLADELDDDGDLPACFHTERPPTLTRSERDDGRLEDDLFLSREPAPGSESPPSAFEDEEEPAPTLLRTPARSPGASRVGWVFASLALALTLTAQVLWTRQDALLQHDGLRPWLERACETFGCRLPLRSDLARIRLVSRDIRPHPSVSGALIISATMQNRAEYRQPHPTVEISLSDLDGQLIAMRRFQPEEYLEEGAGTDDGMTPGTLLPLVFEVVDPGENAVAFEFTFRRPPER